MAAEGVAVRVGEAMVAAARAAVRVVVRVAAARVATRVTARSAKRNARVAPPNGMAQVPSRREEVN